MLQSGIAGGKPLGLALQDVPNKTREVSSDWDKQRFQNLFTSARYQPHQWEG